MKKKKKWYIDNWSFLVSKSILCECVEFFNQPTHLSHPLHSPGVANNTHCNKIYPQKRKNKILYLIKGISDSEEFKIFFFFF